MKKLNKKTKDKLHKVIKGVGGYPVVADRFKCTLSYVNNIVKYNQIISDKKYETLCDLLVEMQKEKKGWKLITKKELMEE